MKRAAILMAVLALAAGCDDDSPTQPSNSGPIVFVAQLSAANEVPPVTGTVTFGIQLNSFPANTAVILAHIHPGAAGVNGGVLVNTGLSQAAPLLLSSGSATVAITVDISQENATNITAAPANFYFNVHTPANSNPGAARGQLVRQ
jgi:hypothetical protein